MTASNKTKVAVATTLCAASALFILLRKRRAARRAAAAQRDAVPAAQPIFTVRNEGGAVAIGEPVSYPPRIATLPVLLKREEMRSVVANVESTFLVVDDLACAPEEIVQLLLTQGAAAFANVYAKQCRFLSDAEGSQPFEPVADCGEFSFRMTTPAFTALLLVDADAGIAATLVVMGTTTTEAATEVAASLLYTGPRDYDDASFESTEAGVAIPPCATSIAHRDVAQDQLHKPAALGVFPKYDKAISTSGKPIDGTVRLNTYSNRHLGVQLGVPQGGAVYTNRITPERRVDVVLDVGDDASSRMSIQEVTLPSAWATNDELFVRGVVLNCTEQLPDGSYPTRVSLNQLAGRRSAVFEQTLEGRWCKTFVCLVGKGPSNAESRALILRWEGEAVNQSAQAAALARFLDTFFLVG